MVPRGYQKTDQTGEAAKNSLILTKVPHLWKGAAFFFFNVYLFLRERDKGGRGGAGRDMRQRILGRLHTVSRDPDTGLELINH